MVFPTDLASFLDLIRQNGEATYGIMFGYAALHSLLIALFAGYAASTGALSLGTLILICWIGSFAGDAVRFLRVGTLDEPDRWPPDIHIFTSSKQPWVVLPSGVPAVPEFYDRKQYWPAASLERRERLLAKAK